MGDRTCTFPDCSRPLKCKGLCGTHYQRVLRHGAPDQNLRPELDQSEEARFWAKVEVSDCWRWLAGVDSTGYGTFRDANGKTVSAHRWAWQRLVGSIPAGKQMDHLCRNRRCVNPDHLEPVTPQENTLRGATIAARHYGKTHCKNGHPFDRQNTVMLKVGKPGQQRGCRQCRRNSSAAARRRASEGDSRAPATVARLLRR